MAIYKPSIKEGVYPDDAGWTQDGSKNILLLSIPMLSHVIRQTVTKFDYAWLYNKEIDAYIFCFKLSNGQEYAIFFQVDHAGRLLMDQNAYEEFSIVLTDKAFNVLTEDSEFITLSNIRLVRQPIAGW